MQSVEQFAEFGHNLVQLAVFGSVSNFGVFDFFFVFAQLRLQLFEFLVALLEYTHSLGVVFFGFG